MPTRKIVLYLLLATGQVGRAAPDDPAGKAPAAARTPTAELQIETGAIRGLLVGNAKDIAVYKGIPYAAPPVVERRWKPPQPARPWNGTRDCFEFGAACPQITLALFATLPEMAIRVPQSEDCLFLNVWTPAHRAQEKLPVLYWIHGGGFIMGASSQALYDGEELARLGCVVVSVNYRLGLFGFLAHPALSAESPERVSGNYGLLDQVEGLRWVRRNIAAFGGDPDRVTIFGESAGGVSVLCLMVSPPAKGLFQGAIAQSATGMDLTRLRESNRASESAEVAGERFIASAGLKGSPDAAQLRQIDAKALVQSGPAEPSFGAPFRLKPLRFTLGPNVDGHVLPDKPETLFATGRAHRVPMIIGSTRDEMTLLAVGVRMPLDEAAYLKTLRDDFGDLADSIAKAYPAHEPQQIRASALQLATDLNFGNEARSTARWHSATGQRTYRYLFSLGSERGFLAALGAHHGADVPYVFQRPSGRAESRTRTSRMLGHYWINFAATGDPNGKDLPTWPAYGVNAEGTLEFGDQVKILKDYRDHELDVIEAVRKRIPAERPQGKPQ